MEEYIAFDSHKHYTWVEREQVAELIGAHARDVIFTSCATESNNAAIAPALKASAGKRHIVTSSVEHSSVLNYCVALDKEGHRASPLSETAKYPVYQSLGGSSTWGALVY